MKLDVSEQSDSLKTKFVSIPCYCSVFYAGHDGSGFTNYAARFQVEEVAS